VSGEQYHVTYNYCVQLTAGADGWRGRVSANARRS
jgi:hypothetical protein